MRDAILVFNAGSSSIKFSVFVARDGELTPSLRGQAEGLYTVPRFAARDSRGTVLSERTWKEGEAVGHDGAMQQILDFLRSQAADHRLVGIGHRVVHGGVQFIEPVRLNAGMLPSLERLVPLAPLHQPHNIAPIRMLLDRLPDVPQVACFDTSFHRTMPRVAQLFALPYEFAEAGVLRYGFHGLSYEFIASVLPKFDTQAAAGRTIVLHLGNGSSMCALRDGRSVESTLSFTAVDGLMMGTRCGTLDPGVILFLMDQRKMDARAIEKLIYQESGLKGVSGISSDMRALLDSDEPRAKLAVDLYVYRIRKELGALAAALGGVDGIVFTAGIGENAAAIRDRICRDAAWLGLRFDETANRNGGPKLSLPDSRVAAWAIPTNEELVIGRHVLRLTGA